MVIPTLFRTKFRIRILYKSGNSHEFWCTKFNISNGTWEWHAVTQSNYPIQLGVDEIEAVWQTGGRLNVFRAIGQILRIVD